MKTQTQTLVIGGWPSSGSFFDRLLLRRDALSNLSLRRLLAPALTGLFFVSPAIAHAQFAYWPLSAGGNGHYYEAVTSPGINWYDASDVATAKGGYLATITSPEENAFIYGVISTNAALWEQRSTGNSWGPWIGGLQLPGSIEPAEGWVWGTGEPCAYANWNAGEPNNIDGLEDRIHFWGQQAAVGDVWNDRPATNNVKGFVIEYETHPNAVWLTISIHDTNELQISWPSRVNVGYTVQWSKGFASTDWGTLTNVTGNGTTCAVFDPISESPRFYRILSTP